MPMLTSTLLKLQKPPMSLKQFMLRSEVLKLYRGFMKLSRLIEPIPPIPNSSSFPVDLSKSVSASKIASGSNVQACRKLDPLQLEWISWVRAEFRLRQDTADEEAIKMMLAHGKRQLQEIERTMLLATNRNSGSNSGKGSSSKTQKLHKTKSSLDSSSLNSSISTDK